VSTDSVHRFLVAYGVGTDQRRSRVAKALESYGDRIQYSVFLVDAKPAKLVRLRVALRGLLETGADRALICDLGPLSGSGGRVLEFIGHPPAVTGDAPLIL
jgi:CRISPR-associated protein Cas2